MVIAKVTNVFFYDLKNSFNGRIQDTDTPVDTRLIVVVVVVVVVVVIVVVTSTN